MRVLKIEVAEVYSDGQVLRLEYDCLSDFMQEIIGMVELQNCNDIKTVDVKITFK